jgi:hypothetical protein
VGEIFLTLQKTPGEQVAVDVGLSSTIAGSAPIGLSLVKFDLKPEKTPKTRHQKHPILYYFLLARPIFT